MTLRLWLLGLGLGLGASACAGLNVGDSTGCAAACERAGLCGFLPSDLGWSAAPDVGSSVTDCERRCGNSPRSEGTVSAIIACLDGEQQSTDWCDDETAAEFLRWRECAGIAICLDKIAQRKYLTGQAALSVSLVEFQDFESDFGAADTDSGGEPLTIADLYASSPNTGEPATSCRAALCSEAACAESEVGRPCDDTLCRNLEPNATHVCDTMGIERIMLIARQPDRAQVRMPMFDAEDGEEARCSRSTSAELDAEDYALVPGPIALGVQVSGTLLASELMQIGYPNADVTAATDPTATMPYCLEFYGPSVILRAGDNPAVIPIGDVDDLVERGLDVTQLGICPD